MKRLFFFICMMFTIINIMAHQPIFVDGHIWTFLMYGESPYPDSENDTWSDTIRYNIIGDTIVDNQIYKILYSSNAAKNRLIRECVEEQKIWEYHEYFKKEELIMNFNLNVGDELESMYSICENISYIKDKSGNFLKQMSFDDNHIVWIEKYGCRTAILDGGSLELLYVTDGNDTLIDFTKKLEYYNPIVIDGYSWNVVNIGDGGNPKQTIYRTNTEVIKGDTIINGVTYKKFWVADDCNLEKVNLLALIREDIEEQKVYAYNKGAEVLLYDFNVEIGDTIKVWNWLYQLKYIDSTNIQDYEYCFSLLVVDNIDYMEDETYKSLKKITYHKANQEHRETTIYERYGDLSGWATSDHAEIDGRGPGIMICAFDATGELQFKPIYNNELDKIENCYINETKTDIENVTISNPSSKKIIHNGQLYIIHEGKTYNAMGIKVKNIY